jgi:hypothetical protein
MRRLRQAARRLKNRFVSRALILMYHRVTELPSHTEAFRGAAGSHPEVCIPGDSWLERLELELVVAAAGLLVTTAA